ncbi:hypothetical protein LX15_000807 [Streptoalloteichus tenebrarius]|uniref:Uncharacterized protein n=1 Tax=Streptoalloteichus tenebrarius (strain ATCC 17920 / DSM 40477 / JCM 4838 / CBS 697.72 / NBRC 16177 / NCIMB 11028 / NRRL B-12390 / A12253. 1 / ISP 5477) TaxID=1933 RepID=A0ABT1HNN8_STRSD|nr:hypothetical protein [Streptoalloteichus tenebrarius]
MVGGGRGGWRESGPRCRRGCRAGVGPRTRVQNQPRRGRVRPHPAHPGRERRRGQELESTEIPTPAAGPAILSCSRTRPDSSQATKPGVITGADVNSHRQRGLGFRPAGLGNVRRLRHPGLKAWRAGVHPCASRARLSVPSGLRGWFPGLVFTCVESSILRRVQPFSASLARRGRDWSDESELDTSLSLGSVDDLVKHRWGAAWAVVPWTRTPKRASKLRGMRNSAPRRGASSPGTPHHAAGCSGMRKSTFARLANHVGAAAGRLRTERAASGVSATTANAIPHQNATGAPPQRAATGPIRSWLTGMVT